MNVNKWWIPTSLAMLCSFNSMAAEKREQQKPNIIYILADDLGYGELGCYGQRLIETPNIDQLAKEGIKFTQHYSGSPVCAPSRCVLLSGKHTGHSYIRGNYPVSGGVNGKTYYESMLSDSSIEGQKSIPADVKLLPAYLKDQGYNTGMIGKWGLGSPTSVSTPNKKGFDFFCGYICQKVAHTYYPTHLYLNEERFYLDNDTVDLDLKLPKGSDPLDVKSYDKFTSNTYSPDVMTSKMREWISRNGKQPFFFYWASPIPHVALQAPKRWVDYYQKKFGDEKPYLANRGYYPCRYPHATYAAMISYLDEQVGVLVKQLKGMGIYDNTLIVFTSDNGPSFNGGTDSPHFNSAGQFNESMGWGKCSVHEGGVRVPMIACWPKRIKKGRTSNHISAFWDVLPTFCQITGHKIPEDTDGISFFNTLVDKRQAMHEYLYWEYPERDGQQAMRYGNWKLIRKNLRRGQVKEALYDLTKDPKEQKNVKEEYPLLFVYVKNLMKKEHTRSNLKKFRMPHVDN
ncbi:arylsulfatase [Halosquirtibacter xylanolyticus]|uniref:arylsulfatase n=1 Tax=Halosquirtibacter xylanolyticus TaxID=3374599 RepID=UPI0037485E92|nr:arylsulfatase [Prolixibacteraceae bacterium]